jgi:cell division protease FtsH
VTQQVPVDDRHTWSREYILDRLAIMFGGRVAEELVLGHMTTGAGDDIEKATELARRMVCEWGMSDHLGPMTFGKKEEQIFLGRDFTQIKDYSEKTALEIDMEVRRIIGNAYDRAKHLLVENREILTRWLMYCSKKRCWMVWRLTRSFNVAAVATGQCENDLPQWNRLLPRRPG